MMSKNVLIFGNGSIGSFLINKLKSENVITIISPREFIVDNIPKVDVVIWCQGVNLNDSIGNLNYENYLTTIDVNLHYITKTLDSLIRHEKINKNGRCLIISSLWQEYAKSKKFSYTVSKSAIGGLVRSCSVDLAEHQIFINALLPGPIDNEMTRANLPSDQIEKLPGFVNLEDIWQLSNYLCLNNMSTNGQSIKIDLGFSIRKF